MHALVIPSGACTPLSSRAERAQHAQSRDYDERVQEPLKFGLVNVNVA